MKVKELREKLAALPENEEVRIYWENDNSGEQWFFVIDDVSLARGNPSRKDGKPSFEFANAGSAEWPFIQVSRES